MNPEHLLPPIHTLRTVRTADTWANQTLPLLTHNPYQPTTTVRDTPPNPGSDEAITQGCRCPRMDNGLIHEPLQNPKGCERWQEQ